MHYSFKIAYVSQERYTEGKCFGYTEDDKDEDGFSISRWTNSEKTCDRFKLDYPMAVERSKRVTPDRFKKKPALEATEGRR
jgi:hypothetical protein